MIHGAICVAVVRVTRNQAQRKRRNSREIAHMGNSETDSILCSTWEPGRSTVIT